MPDATWTHEIAPGQSGIIPIQIMTGGFTSGPFSKTVRVISNDRTRPNATLRIGGVVRLPIEVAPAVVSFTLRPGATNRNTRVIKIFNRMATPLTLSNPQSTTNVFSGVLRTVVTGQEFELTVSEALSADLLPSPGTTVIQGQISLESSATNRNPLTIPVFVIIPQESAIVPAIIPLPVAPLAQSSNSASSRFVKDNVNDASQTLLGYVPKEVSSSTLLYHADASETLDLRVVLPLRPGVDDLIKQLYDPKSPIFHHFLTPKQFAEQFGPSALDSEPVKQFLLSQGFSISEQSADGSVLHVTCSVLAVEGAFKVHISHYAKADGTTFFAPNVDPTIPVQIAGKISAMIGMDNLQRFRPHYHLLHQNTKNIAIPQGGRV
jgi:hypothetical protein